jgi:hypothetical protein
MKGIEVIIRAQDREVCVGNDEEGEPFIDRIT